MERLHGPEGGGEVGGGGGAGGRAIFLESTDEVVADKACKEG